MKIFKNLSLLFLLIFFQQGYSQSNSQDSIFSESEITINKYIDGTLTLPNATQKSDLVILIQGSGPVDRNGNANMMKNDASKKIAHGLAEKGIASYRFDKRIFKMQQLQIQEKDLKFQDFVTDVDSILSYFKQKNEFKKIIIAGHSEGSLIGILATQQEGADAFISLAGAGRSIDSIVVEQISKQSPELANNARESFDEIKATGTSTNYNPLLVSIFRPSVQPFIGSWMQYDPAQEISKLKIPVLIINGSFDIQVDETDANRLHQANPDSKLVILDKMNHIFRKIDGDALENTKAYNQPELPLHPELIPTLVDFIDTIK